MAALDISILSQLKHSGHRRTRARQAVISALVEADGWLTPEELCLRARGSYPNLGLVSVYRTLHLLVGLGFARRVHGSDGGHGFAAAGPGHSHHLICHRCHQTIEFEECELEKLIDTIGSRTGYAIDGHMLELRGLCPRCQQLEGSDEQPQA
jgi:Fur family ferric uptake transcriptional regulator